MPEEGELQLYEEGGLLNSVWSGLKSVTYPIAFAAGLFFSSPDPARAAEARPSPEREPKITLNELKKRPEFTGVFDILSENRRTGACEVGVDGKLYIAFPLSRRGFEPDADDPIELSRQLSRKRPWLITHRGEVVQDSETYYQAALVANYTRMFNHEGLAQSLENEAARYRGVLAHSKVPRAVLGVTKPTTQLLFTLLLSDKTKIPKIAEGYALNILKEEIVGEFLGELRKILIKKPNMSTDGAFNSAMCEIISQSAGELDAAAQTMLRMRYPFRYRDIKGLSDQIIDARSDAHSALIGLACYYGAGDPAGRWGRYAGIRPVFNFLVEQVGKPFAKGALGAELDSKITGPIINRLVQIRPEAQMAYFEEAKKAEALNEWMYGRGSVTPGSYSVFRELVGMYGNPEVEKIPKERIRKAGRDGKMQRFLVDDATLYLELQEDGELEVYGAMVGNVDADVGRETVIAFNPAKPYTKDSRPYLVVAKRRGGRYEVLYTKPLGGGVIDETIIQERFRSNVFRLVDMDYNGINEISVIARQITKYTNDRNYYSPLTLFSLDREGIPNINVGKPAEIEKLKMRCSLAAILIVTEKSIVEYVDLDKTGNKEFVYFSGRGGGFISDTLGRKIPTDEIDKFFELAKRYFTKIGVKTYF